MATTIPKAHDPATVPELPAGQVGPVLPGHTCGGRFRLFGPGGAWTEES